MNSASTRRPRPSGLLIAWWVCVLCCVLIAPRGLLLAAETISTSKDNARLREGPGLNTPVVKVLVKGAVLTVLDRGAAPENGEPAWFHVQTESGWKGYIREDMLSDVSYAPLGNATSPEIVEAEPLLPTPPAAEPPPAPEDIPSAVHGQTQENIAGDLDRDVEEDVRELSREDAREDVHENVHEDIARDIDEDAITQVEILARDAAEAEELTPTAATTAFVARDRVNLRDAPGTNAASLGLLPKGLEMLVLQREPGPQSQDWLLVQTADNRAGYVREDMLVLGQAGSLQPDISHLEITPAKGRLYVAARTLSLRGAPALNAPPLEKLRQNQSLELKGRVESEEQGDTEAPDWLQVRTIGGVEGFVPQDAVSDSRLELLLREKLLLLLQGDKELGRFPVRLCQTEAPQDAADQDAAAEPEEDATSEPEDGAQNPPQKSKPLLPVPGRYTLLSGGPDGQEETLHCVWPNARAARQALGEGRLSYEQYVEIIRALHNGETPPQNTLLGHGPRILVGDSCPDCAQGCVLVSAEVMAALWEALPQRARLDVYLSESLKAALRMPQYISSRLVGSMYQQLERPAAFTADALDIIPMPYPGGDIAPDKGLDADVVVRALRHMDVDPQALVHEDVLVAPEAYDWVNTPNPSIDHRRAANLAVWLQRHTLSLPLDITTAPLAFQPGDILVFDSNVPNGTPYDQVGLVSMERSHGLPLVFTIRGPGDHTRNVPFLDGPEPKLVGHFRLAHPYEYR